STIVIAKAIGSAATRARRVPPESSAHTSRPAIGFWNLRCQTRPSTDCSRPARTGRDGRRAAGAESLGPAEPDGRHRSEGPEVAAAGSRMGTFWPRGTVPKQRDAILASIRSATAAARLCQERYRTTAGLAALAQL